MFVLYGCSALLIAADCAVISLHIVWLAGLLSILCAVTVIFAVYMQACRSTLSFSGGKLMEMIHEFVLDHLNWDGHGTVLEIGCGTAALGIQCAQKYPKASVVGIDYWGKACNYAEERCEHNALAEGVSGRMRFMKGDIAHLPFAASTFDAAISNFASRKVKLQPDKRLVVKEALRVIKKGSPFVFHDMFEKKELYGDIQAFVRELRQEGVTELHYISHTESLNFIPNYIKVPWILKNMGLLYGRR